MSDIIINDYLEKQGIKHSILGFKYLTTAIHIGLDSPLMCIRITDIYDKIAESHNTNSSAVERSIRYAILDKNVSNKEFITKAVDKLGINSRK